MKRTVCQIENRRQKPSELQARGYRIFQQKILLTTFSQLLNLQSNLINELIINKKLIKQCFTPLEKDTKSKSTNQETEKNQYLRSEIGNSSNKESNQKSAKAGDSDVVQEKPKAPKKTKKIFKQMHGSSESSCYNPSQQASSKVHQKKSRQTKHIPKNYGKSILKFVKMHPQIANDLCKQYEMDNKKFWEIVQSYKGKIQTILHLRSLWIQQENSFAKIFRIISMYYLRKHSLAQVFNSRALNLSRHIKYRYKIIQAVKNPIQFSQIKDF